MKNKLMKLWRLLCTPGKLRAYARFLIGYSRPFWPSLALMTVIDVLIILVGFGSSFISKDVVDSASAGRPYVQAFMLMVGVTAASIGINAALGILQTLINERFAFGIRLKVFDQILSANYLGLSRYHSGDLMTRLTSDAGTIAGSIASAIPGLAMILLRLVVAFVLLYRFSPFLALSALLLAPGGLLVSLFTGRKMKKLAAELKESEAAYRSFLQEHTANITVVKTFCMEEHSRVRLGQLRQQMLDTTLRRNRLSVTTGTLIRVLFSTGYLLSFGYCLSGLHGGHLTYGTMTLFLTLFSQIQQPLVNLTHLLPQAIGILASADRIMELEAIPRDARSGSTAMPEEVALCVKDVSFTYGKDMVLNHVSFSAGPGQIVGIMGPSGAGKTTLIRLVLALMQPTEGYMAFRYDGMEEPLSADARRLIAYVPQGNTLLSGTIRENLQWGCPGATEAEMYQVLEDAAAGFVRELPEGLDTPLGEKASGLSEGQAQRIAIARALLRRSPVLILDEATSALDEASEKTILTRLSDPRRTYMPLCLIITHRSSMRPYFDQLLTINRDGMAMVSSPKADA